MTGREEIKNRIIEELAKDKVIEDIVYNVAKNNDDTLKDLSQMLYMELLEKDSELIERLYATKQLKFFITRMVTNNIISKNSRYYYLFKKPNRNNVELSEFKDGQEEDWD